MGRVKISEKREVLSLRKARNKIVPIHSIRWHGTQINTQINVKVQEISILEAPVQQRISLTTIGQSHQKVIQKMELRTPIAPIMKQKDNYTRESKTYRAKEQ